MSVVKHFYQRKIHTQNNRLQKKQQTISHNKHPGHQSINTQMVLSIFPCRWQEFIQRDKVSTGSAKSERKKREKANRTVLNSIDDKYQAYLVI